MRLTIRSGPGNTLIFLQNELQRLSLLVDKVLKLSMFEKQEIELKTETLNLLGVVTEVVDSLKLQLEKNHATVSVTHEGDLTHTGETGYIY
ncbi:MAG: hypothetical protein IPQ25_10430 [Chitinophagaceae bacterium]|nr:hypothetical protein [Chitinophagaceae bacterium]